LRLDRQLGVGEAGHREGYAIGILAGPLDVIGRIGRTAAFETRRLVEHGKQPIEADGGTIKGGKIESTHGIVLLEATCRSSPPHQEAGPRVQRMGLHEQRFRKPLPGFRGCRSYAFPRIFLLEQGTPCSLSPRGGRGSGWGGGFTSLSPPN